MRKRRAVTLALLTLAGQAVAAPAPKHPAQCRVAQHLIEASFPLPRVARAITAKKLTVLVLGAGSSQLPGPNGAKTSYPARLQYALEQALPGVTVKVTTNVRSRRSAAAMLKALPLALTAAKPALVIWQTGTVDAMQAVDQDAFNDALEQGIATAHAAAADLVFVNAQYSPRTESIIALATYMEDMRWVAVQHEVPLFDRFAMMKLWAELGTFDFTTAVNKLDMAQQVHDCIGRLLSDLVVEGAKAGGPRAGGR